MRQFLTARWSEKNSKMHFWFTIIAKYHKNIKGYIIMEIMSTNVINTTRYRGKIHRITTYFVLYFTKGLHNKFM